MLKIIFHKEPIGLQLKPGRSICWLQNLKVIWTNENLHWNVMIQKFVQAYMNYSKILYCIDEEEVDISHYQGHEPSFWSIYTVRPWFI